MVKLVVVIGGAGAIGSAIVRKYIDSGYQVVVADLNQEKKHEIIQQNNDNYLFIPVDVLNTQSLSTFSVTLKSNFESITHLVSLAGGALPEEHTLIENCPSEIISESIDLNLKSHLYIIKEIVPLLKRNDNNNSTITLISSINALRCFGLPSYSSAKAGLLGLVCSSAEELGEKGIRINAVLPGTVPTPRTNKLPKNFQRLKEATILKKFATPEEIASVVYCLTDLMTCVTGQAIVADCGQSIKGII